MGTPVSVESTLKYHSGRIGCLTSVRDPDQGQCQMGSLTGAVALTHILFSLSPDLSGKNMLGRSDGDIGYQIRPYAGTSEYLALLIALRCGSENASSADNQQERPVLGRESPTTIRRGLANQTALPWVMARTLYSLNSVAMQRILIR